MSLEAAPWAKRVQELYENGVSLHGIARDPELLNSWLSDLSIESSRVYRVLRTVRMLAEAGVLALRKSEPINDPAPKQKQGGLYEELRERYERLLGLPCSDRGNPSLLREFRPAGEVALGTNQTSVVISDLHIPCEREDLIAEIVRRHGGQGLPLYIVGDVFDWEGFSRYESMDLKPPSMESVLTRAEVLFNLLYQKFYSIYLLEGNHDKRPFKKAMKASPGLAWLTQSFLRWVYRERYGVQLVERPVACIGDSVTYCTQVGDCVMGHVERGGGKQAAFGAREAHGHYTRFARELGINEFSTVLQAHTHKTSLSRHPDTRKVLVEIGCLSNAQNYAFHRHDFLAPERGYFELHQEDGITDLNRSRLHLLD